MDDKAAADKAAADKVAADKAAAEKAEQVTKVAQERAAQEKAAEAKAAAEKAQAQMIAAQKAKKEQGARAQSSLAEMQSAMLGDWVLTFQNPGSGRGRLKITNVSQNPDGGFQIFGTYAYGDNQTFALKSGELTKSGSASQLKLTTALGSLFVAESQGEGSFRGESYPAKGPKDPFKMEKAAAEKAVAEKALEEKLAAEKAAAENVAAEKTAAAKAMTDRPTTKSPYDGYWLGEEGIWRLRVNVSGAQVEGTIQCFSKGSWSTSPTIVGTIATDGTVKAQMTTRPGTWALRQIFGKFPSLRIWPQLRVISIAQMVT